MFAGGVFFLMNCRNAGYKFKNNSYAGRDKPVKQKTGK
jgi:hypothetical protein